MFKNRTTSLSPPPGDTLGADQEIQTKFEIKLNVQETEPAYCGAHLLFYHPRDRGRWVDLCEFPGFIERPPNPQKKHIYKSLTKHPPQIKGRKEGKKKETL